MDYREADDAALRRALLALGRCPKCRRKLRKGYTGKGMERSTHLACVSCDETYDVEVDAK